MIGQCGAEEKINVQTSPLPKKSHSQDHPGFNFKKNYFAVHNLVFSWQKTALTFTVMQHEPA